MDQRQTGADKSVLKEWWVRTMPKIMKMRKRTKRKTNKNKVDEQRFRACS